MKHLFLLMSALTCSLISFSQIVWTEPAFPTQDETVTLYYDASLGNGDLSGAVPVYIHTGVITNLSEDNTDWQHVIGNWGTADANVIMTPLGNNVHQFTFAGSTLETFYDLEDGETISALTMVFRNQTGSSVGRLEDGGDIYFNLTDGTFSALISSPEAASIAIEVGEEIDVLAQCSASADLTINVNGSEELTGNSVTELNYTFSSDVSGEFEIEFAANNGLETITDSFTVVVLPAQVSESIPAGMQEGINYISDTSVLFELYAPGKENIFVIGDFNNWELGLDYMMKLGDDGETFWLQVDGLQPNQEYRMQYNILSDNMKMADAYSPKILDPWNDPWIEEETYPNLLEYPTGLTSQPVTVFQTNEQEFDWTDDSFVRPSQDKLIVYELLLRDFIDDHSYQVLEDSLEYLSRLGINAIQFMPVSEFEGNESWGYNPSFFFAPDKYYGTSDAYKSLINAAHENGMAVIMDIALNHSFGQNPQVRMYFDADAGAFGEPTAESPWFNQQAMHDFNVGYDYNHESPRTRAFCKRVLEHWLNEYHVDGYRMDLSKGFTQNNTLGNIGAWNAYDQSRVDILNDYKNHVQSEAPGAYMILEHFADNGEETALANQGFMLWGNLNHEYNEATLGYTSDLSWGSYQQRGWNSPNLITYMESHDEERLMVKNLEFGNSNGSYDITELNTSLARMELAHCFLIPIPGPKMIWQFGELGYDFSINYCTDGTISENCRTGNKPIRWDYQENANRSRVYNVVAALNHLKQTEPAFSTNDFDIDLGGFGKRIHLNHASMNVVVVGNFDVINIDMVPGFQNTGTWYDYFTGEAIEVSDLNTSFNYEAGEYHIYTSVQLETPVIDTSVEELDLSSIELYPNPFEDQLSVQLQGINGEFEISIMDLSGRTVKSEVRSVSSKGAQNKLVLTELDHLLPGTYVLKVANSEGLSLSRLVLKK